MAVFPGNFYSRVNPAHHQNPSQKILHNTLVLLLRLNQGTRKTQSTRLFQGFLPGKIITSPYAGKWKKGGPPQLILFQIADKLLGCLLIVRDNILNIASKSRLDGCLILLIHLDNIRHNAENPRRPFLALHHFADTVAVAVIPLRQIPKRLKLGGFPVKCGLSNLQLLIEPPKSTAAALGLLLLLSLSSRQLQDSGLNLPKLSLVLLIKHLLLRLAAPGLQKLLIQLRPSDLGLLLHGVIPLQPSLCGSTLIQKTDNRIFPLLHPAVQSFHFPADGI